MHGISPAPFPSFTGSRAIRTPRHLRSIEAWRASGTDNLLPPIALDASSRDWPLDAADAILCINMVHISPWAATLGLLDGAARLLDPGAPLILYGAYRRSDVPTAPNNEAFDRSLRASNPEWGLRRLEDVAAEAGRRGLALESVVAMPANNLTLVFRAV